MAYKESDDIFIVTQKRGFIPQLKQEGPIVCPIKISVGRCLAMLTSGVPLYQYDPISKITIPLDMNNILDDKKFEVTIKDEIEVIEPPILSQSQISLGGNADLGKESKEINDTDDKLEDTKDEDTKVEAVKTENDTPTATPTPASVPTVNTQKNKHNNQKK